MIFVDRWAVPDPFMRDPLASRAASDLERARQRVASHQFQERFEFQAYRRPEVKSALVALFHNKCAYCEVPFTSAPADIEQYRPKSGVTEAPRHLGYWWLANDWSNLLLACQNCNRLTRSELSEAGRLEPVGKYNRFPLVHEEQRAYSPEDAIEREQPLLLDPTRDDPVDHLVFTEEGFVHSETERGNTTISVLGLNRLGLVKERALTAQRYRYALEGIRDAIRRGETLAELGLKLEQLHEMGSDEAPYAGLMRQLLRRDWPALQKDIQGLGSLETVGLSAPDLVVEPSAPMTTARVRKAAAVSREYRERMANYSLADADGITRYKSQRRSIEAISIRNIRAVRSFDVNLAREDSGGGSWLMLLGENGTGKSTVLQAVALVLGGSEYVSRLIRDARISLGELVRSRCRSASISVKLSGFGSAHRLRVWRDRLEFTSPGGETVKIDAAGKVTGHAWAPQTVMAGYGATRLSGRPGLQAVEGGTFARVENLFDPFVPLIDAESWLCRLSTFEFDRTAIILKDLLGIDPGAKMTRGAGKVSVSLPGGRMRLGALSMGYQTVLAAAADILEILSRVWPNPLDAEGIALIDELDAHLHPRWQMQIVSSLRKALPAVQFIVTTHQPLCLRGLVEGEIVVMRHNAACGIETIKDLPSPADFRVDQLLTSSFFGLNSTTDPETEKLFGRYYALLAMDVRSTEQETELARLRGELDERRQFGTTQREALYFEAIDRVLAKGSVVAAPARQVREEAINEVSAIWEQLMASAARNGGAA